jgi:hypothetical protein
LAQSERACVKSRLRSEIVAANSNVQTFASSAARTISAEQRLEQLCIKLASPPEPFGTNLLFLTGMLPTKFVGRVGAELDVETGREAAHLAALNLLAVARKHLGSLDRVTRIVRLGVSVATSGGRA